jgi:hypothetical protein
MLLQKKIPGYIDFKSIDDIMSGRYPSKNLELSPSDIMRFKYASSIDIGLCGMII